jgi:hypothetical protein
MKVNEEDFPEAYRPIIRRLRMAAESEDIQIEMEMEDDYLKELQDKDRIIAQKEKEVAKEKKLNKEQKKALEEQEKVIDELKKQLAGRRVAKK